MPEREDEQVIDLVSVHDDASLAKIVLELRERVRLLEQERDGFKRLFESAQDASEAAEQREKGLREVAHQLVGWSRTVEGGRATDGYPTLRAIVKNADAALAADQAGKPSDG